MFLFDMIGTVAFSFSGAVVGIEKKMDVFGVSMLGVITAVGGGILRDIIIGNTPPMAFQKPVFSLVALVAALIIFIPEINKRIYLNQMKWVIIDAIGLAAFTVTGVECGMKYDNLLLEIFLGTVTGVGGGVIRDICALEMPVIFVKHFYACASIAGAVICGILYPVNKNIAVALSVLVVITLRICAAKYKWTLPKARG